MWVGLTKKHVFLLAFAGIILAFFMSGAHQVLNLESLKEHQVALNHFKQTQPWLVASLFFAGYVAVTAFSLPAAAFLTLLAGALFGAVWGTVLVSFASTLGATLAMLMARFILRDSLQSKYSQQLAGINQGFAAEGAFYLFALRLVPVVPFFMVNLLMGLLPIRTQTYFWVSQLGMLPGTAVYVYAGTALATITSLNDIVSPQLLLAFALLGLLPLATKFSLKYLRKRRDS